jgi:hypothetical protein
MVWLFWGPQVIRWYLERAGWNGAAW